MDNNLSFIVEVKEVFAGVGQQDSRHIEKQVNELLADGWVLLDIHQRATTDDFGHTSISSYYILGRKA